MEMSEEKNNTIDLNEALSLANNLIKEEQEKLKSLNSNSNNSKIKEENLDSIMKMASSLINSSLSKKETPKQENHSEKILNLAIEQVLDKLDKVEQELDKMKNQINKLNKKYIELNEKITN